MRPMVTKEHAAILLRREAEAVKGYELRNELLEIIGTAEDNAMDIPSTNPDAFNDNVLRTLEMLVTEWAVSAAAHNWFACRGIQG